MRNSFLLGALNWKLWLFPGALCLLLIVIAQYSFLAFHSLIEMFSVIVCFVMAAFGWWTRHFKQSYLLLYLAAGYFWIGCLDLLHLFSYKGIDIIFTGSGNLAVQFWISARFMEAFLLLGATLVTFSKSNLINLSLFYGVISICISSLILTGYFPVLYIDGQGLTALKIISEYIIIFILAIAIYRFVKFKLFSQSNYLEVELIIVSIILTMCAELAFTFYIDVYGLSNLVGHVFKLFSFWIIFQAIVAINIKKPYSDLVEQDLKFKMLFENSEISIWEEDMTAVAIKLEELRGSGVKNVSQYFNRNIEEAWLLASQVKVINVNNATLELFKSSSKKRFVAQIDRSFGSDAIDVFILSLEAIWNQQPAFRSEATFIDSNGKEIKAIISYPIPKKIEEFVSIPVSIVDITQRIKDEEVIAHQANYDNLTELANRNLFSDRLSHHLDLAERAESELALLFLDLDGFKHVNDSQGHEIGDKLLRQVADRIILSVRKSDTVARFGGDEFVILLPDSGGEEMITDVVTKILSNIEKPYKIDNIETFISACIGVTVFPKDGTTVTTLLRKADSAMYRAKAKGSSNYQFFNEEMERENKQRSELEYALHQAIKNTEFTVVYQPIINIHSNQFTHCEALVRWQHPTKGTIFPDQFIPLAEELGLINVIGEYVLKQACNEAVKWQNAGHEISVAVNLSSYQFKDHKIIETVKSILEETGLPANRLVLEITEGLFMQSEYQPLMQLEGLSALGVKISMDDFGTGYSSLSYLKRFPIDILKIDKSFINDISIEKESDELVKTIILMGKGLGLDIVAEGVETEQQKAFLEQLDCDFIQGYLFSKPIEQSKFIPWLSDQK